MKTLKKSQSGKLSTPGAILAAGVLIAISIFVTSSTNKTVPDTEAVVNTPSQDGEILTELKADITDTDHVYGNKDTAKVFIIEYSDLDCPFCGSVHSTIQEVVDESNGDVAWVYRHFPLESLHPDAKNKAIASECVAKLADENSFWTYIGGIFNGLSEDTYKNFGINPSDFEECKKDESIIAIVDSHITRGREVGATGTPHNVIATKDFGAGISGALPKESFKQAITILSEYTE